jgi:hypothetical protein
MAGDILGENAQTENDRIGVDGVRRERSAGLSRSTDLTTSS